MSNQYEGALKAAILEAVKKPDGMLTAQIQGFTVPQIGRMVQKLQCAHLVFRAPIGGKFGRYFDSLTRAEEFANRPKGKPIPGVVVKKATAWSAAAPAIIPEGLETIELPCYLGHKHDTKPEEVTACFSSLRPGQYIAPASSWVEAVAA